MLAVFKSRDQYRRTIRFYGSILKENVAVMKH